LDLFDYYLLLPLKFYANLIVGASKCIAPFRFTFNLLSPSSPSDSLTVEMPTNFSVDSKFYCVFYLLNLNDTSNGKQLPFLSPYCNFSSNLINIQFPLAQLNSGTYLVEVSNLSSSIPIGANLFQVSKTAELVFNFSISGEKYLAVTP